MKKVLFVFIIFLSVGLYAALSKNEYLNDFVDTESYFTIDTIKIEGMNRNGYVVKYYSGSDLIKEQQWIPEFVNVNYDTVASDTFQKPEGQETYTWTIIDSTYKVYEIFSNNITTFAIEEKYSTISYREMNYDLLGENCDYYSLSRYDEEGVQNRSISVFNSEGEQLSSINLLENGFMAEEGYTLTGSKTYLPPFGDVVMLTDAGELCIKQRKGTSLSNDLYKFFDKDGNLIYTKLMRGAFEPKELCIIDNEYYLINVLEDSIFLDKFSLGSSQEKKIGLTDYMKRLDAYLFSDSNNIVICFDNQNITGAEFGTGIICYEKGTLAIDTAIELQELTGCKILSLNDHNVFYIKTVGDTNYIRNLDYYTGNISNILATTNTLCSIEEIDGILFITFKINELFYEMYKINTNNVAIENVSIISDLIW